MHRLRVPIAPLQTGMYFERMMIAKMRWPMLLLTIAVSSCLLEDLIVYVPVEMKLESEDSIQNAYGTITLSFSKEMQVPGTPFSWSPPHFHYWTEWNAGSDTAKLHLQQDLDYGTAYTIFPSESLKSQGGDTVAAPVTFTTIAGEREPNNAGNIADHLALDSIVAGQIDPRVDVDYFLYAHAGSADSLRVVLSKEKGAMDLAMFNGNESREIGKLSGSRLQQDTLGIPIPESGNYLLRLSAAGNAVGGRYRLLIESAQ